jgi:hypothetical protein
MPYKAPWTLEGRSAVLPAKAPALLAAEPPPDRADFIGLSIELTGFDEVELLGTGAADLYHPWLLRELPEVLDELLAAWRETREDPDREAAMRKILSDPKLGPLARALTALWYTATWTQLPADWWKRYGGGSENVNQVFGAAYPEGLVWKAANLHPTAAKPTGFGTWAFPPP